MDKAPSQKPRSSTTGQRRKMGMSQTKNMILAGKAKEKNYLERTIKLAEKGRRQK